MPSAEADFAAVLPAVSSSGERAAIARGNTVEVYKLPGGQLLRKITHGAVVTAVAFAATGHDLVSGASDGSVVVASDDRAPVHLPLAAGGIDAVAILRNNEVVVADARKHLRFYGPDYTTVLADVALDRRVGLLRPSGDNRRLIAIPSYVAETGPPVLLDLEHHQVLVTLSGHIGRVFSARFVRADREFLTTGGDGSVRSWNASNGLLLRTYRGSARYLADATLSPDGSMVVAGGGDGLLRFWDTANGRPLWTMPAHKSSLIGLHFEGADIVTRGFGGEVARWTVPNTPETFEVAATSAP
jgi:WD40 repeat protein